MSGHSDEDRRPAPRRHPRPAIEPIAAAGPPAARRARLHPGRGRDVGGRPAAVRQLLDGRLRRAGRRRRHGQRRRRRCGCPWSATSPPERRSSYTVQPGLSVRIMTGAPVPTGADAVVPLEWTDGGLAAVTIDRPAVVGAHIRRRGEDVTTGQTGAGGRHPARAGPARPARCRRPGPCRGPAAPAGRRRVHRQRAGGARHPTRGRARSTTRTPTCSPPRPARRARPRSASASSPTTPRTLMNALEDQLIRADLVLTSGGVSVGAYDVVKEVLSRLGTVTFEKVAMQPGQAAGLRHHRARLDADHHAAGQPGVVVRVVRGVRAPGDPPDARCRAAAPADRAGRVPRGAPVAGREAAVRCAAGSTSPKAATSCGPSAAPART